MRQTSCLIHLDMMPFSGISSVVARVLFLIFTSTVTCAIGSAVQAAECASGSASGGTLVSVSSGACSVTSATNPNWVISSNTATVTINSVTINIPYLSPPTIPAGVTAQGGGAINIEGSTSISTSQGGATLLLSTGVDSVITAEGDGLNLSAPNGGATVAVAQNGGRIVLDDGTNINLQGGGGNQALLANGAGSDIETNGITITANASGGNDFAARSTAGANASLTATTVNITANGGGTIALQADGQSAGGLPSTLSATDSTVNFVGGDASRGAAALSGGQVALTDSAISLSGGGGSKVGVQSNAGTVTSNNTQISVSGTGNDIGVQALNGGFVALTGGSVSAAGTGNGEIGLEAAGANSAIDAENVSIAVPSSTNGAGALATGGGQIALNGGNITTQGSGTGALEAFGGTLTAANVTTRTSGANAPGGTLENGGMMTVDGGSLTASGPGSYGFLVQSGGTNTLNLADTTIASAADSFHIQSAAANITVNGSTVTDNNGSLLSTQLSSTVSLAADASQLAGAITTDPTSTSDVTLDNATTWTMTGSSNASNLSNTSSHIIFTPPAGDPQQVPSYKTLTVNNDYTGVGGEIVLNTYLNEGGLLSNQFTDRVLIQGNATGKTEVNVLNTGGQGGITSLTGIADPDDGISIIQVSGSSTPSAFTLPGGYVTGGTPYTYTLNAYGPGSPNGPASPGQSLVGNAGVFWDYRLQNQYVDPQGPIIEPEEPGDETENPGTDVPTAPGTEEPDQPGEPLEPIIPFPPDSRPEVAPQVPAYISTPRALFQAGSLDIDSLHRRLGEIRDEQTLGYDPAVETFVRVYGGFFNYKTSRSFQNFGFNFKEDYGAVQFGVSRILYTDNHGALRIGLAGTVGRLWMQPSAVDGNSKALFNTQSLAGLVTWQAYSGWYVDGIVNGGLFDGRYTTLTRAKTLGMNGTSFAASIEGGIPFDLPWWDLSLEPQAQLIWQHLQFANRTDADGIDVDLGSPNQGLMRLGFRLKRPFLSESGMLFTPYLKANLLQGIGGAGHVILSGDFFDTGSQGTALQLGGGVTGTIGPNFAIYGDAAWQDHVTTSGFRGWLFNAGLRYDFGNAPPPAPALAAPAAAPAPVGARRYLVFFDWDKATLTQRARAVVADAARNATQVQDTRLVVNGYTDASGTLRYNLDLSVRRAKVVEGELVQDGVPQNEIAIHGYGDTNLLVPTGPGVREPQNRRVEIYVQ